LLYNLEQKDLRCSVPNAATPWWRKTVYLPAFAATCHFRQNSTGIFTIVLQQTLDNPGNHIGKTVLAVHGIVQVVVYARLKKNLA